MKISTMIGLLLVLAPLIAMATGIGLGKDFDFVWKVWLMLMFFGTLVMGYMSIIMHIFKKHLASERVKIK